MCGIFRVAFIVNEKISAVRLCDNNTFNSMATGQKDMRTMPNGLKCRRKYKKHRF